LKAAHRNLFKVLQVEKQLVLGDIILNLGNIIFKKFICLKLQNCLAIIIRAIYEKNNSLFSER